MNDGKTKSAAGLYTRVDLDEVLYTDNFSVCKSCIGCGKCRTVCPQNCIDIGEPKPYNIRQNNCLHCGACFENCPIGAIERL